jgi:ATP-dependent helicase/nuclease subunit B
MNGCSGFANGVILTHYPHFGHFSKTFNAVVVFSIEETSVLWKIFPAHRSRKDAPIRRPLADTMIEESFLYQAAGLIAGRHGHRMDRVAVVLPGNRATLFFRSALSKVVNRSFIAPVISTLPAFVERATGIRILNRTELLFRLYECYCKVAKSPEPFHSFMKWATLALDDFNDIAHGLIDTDQFFRDLRDIRDIENWSFSADPLSPMQEDYRVFWRMLGALYREFSVADQRGHSYASLTRNLAESNVFFRGSFMPDHLWIVGLSSLTRAEAKWIDRLTGEGRASCLWDTDSWYVDNEMHEAGAFFRSRKIVDQFSPQSNFLRIPKKIRIHECTTSFGQLWAANELLASISQSELENTVVVITDASLVSSFVQGLPALPCKVNVAMGLSIKHEPLFKLLVDLLAVQKQFALNRDKGIHYELFLRICSNPAWVSITKTPPELARNWLVERVNVFLRAPDLADFTGRWVSASKIVDVWFREVDDPQLWIDQCLNLIDEVFNDPGQSEFNREVAHRLGRLFRVIQEHFRRHKFLTDIDSLDAVINHLIGQESLSYGGEPLEGLQVLSMVETRAIDFERVLIIGANDDHLPGGSFFQSLLPFDLRAYYKLPLPTDRDSTYAYTFYRLIQRSRFVDMFFSAIIADFKGSEVSRYATQLGLELPKGSPLSEIVYRRVSVPANDILPGVSDPHQDDFSLSRLKTLFAKGISPSAIGAYLRCPRDFYYRYILGIREKEEMEEQMSEATFGQIIHRIWEVFMRSFEGSFPAQEDWSAFSLSLDQRIDDVLAEVYPGNPSNGGFNRIQVGVIRRMILQQVEFEKSNHEAFVAKGVVHVVRKVEESLRVEIPEASLAVGFPVWLAGKADRIDQYGDSTLIIDYKTGKVDRNMSSPARDSAKWFSRGNEKLIQIMAYSVMYHRANPDIPEPNAALLSLRDLSGGYISLDRLREADPDWSSTFIEEFVRFVKALCESEKFAHDESSTYCVFCNSSK